MFGLAVKKQQKRRVFTVKARWIYSREQRSWGVVIKVAESPYLVGSRRASDSEPFRGGKAYMVVSADPSRFWIDWIEAWEVR